jgi:NTP pyrophosphatase (non-canonical NTP hydrolase)
MSLTFNEYQQEAMLTAIYPDKGENIIYPVLGLVGEAGEVAEKLKKIIRDKEGVFDETDTEAIIKEVGDVLWYIAAICDELDVDMSYVADINISKLKSRRERNTIQGNGDNR